MQDTIALRAPVVIDGEPVRELTYDIDKVSPDQFIEAEIYAANVATRLHKPSTKVVELDAGFHYYLGVMAIIAENPAYSVQDIERVQGPDIRKVMDVGRNFMMNDAEEDEDEESASIEPEDGEEPGSFLPMPEYGAASFGAPCAITAGCSTPR